MRKSAWLQSILFLLFLPQFPLLLGCSPVRSDSPALHPGISDDVFARETLEVDDVSGAQLLAKFQTGRIVDPRHVTLMMRRNGQGSPLEGVPLLRHGPIGVERRQNFRHWVHVANLLPVKLPVLVVEEGIDRNDHGLIIFGRLNPMPVPPAMSRSLSYAHDDDDDDVDDDDVDDDVNDDDDDDDVDNDDVDNDDEEVEHDDNDDDDGLSIV